MRGERDRQRQTETEKGGRQTDRQTKRQTAVPTESVD